MIMIDIFIIILIAAFTYLTIVIDSYVQYGSIRYRHYDIIVKNIETNVENKISVRAFGQIHAIDKAAKKFGCGEHILFKIVDK